MINCLSSSKFANLLFVNVQIGNVNAIALLLGYDFLEGRDWLLEQAFRLLP